MEQLSKVPRKKDLLVQQRLLDTLNSLRDFYYCEGEGVRGRALDCETYLVRCLSSLMPQISVHYSGPTKEDPWAVLALTGRGSGGHIFMAWDIQPTNELISFSVVVAV